MRSRLRPLVILATCLGATAPCVGQQAGLAERNLEEIGEWLSSHLPEYGTFSIRVTVDAVTSDVTLAVGSIRAREELTEASLHNCQLRYASEFRLVPDLLGPPVMSEVVVPLAAVDIPSIMVQPYDLPAGTDFTMTDPAWEVYLSGLASAQPFSVTIDEVQTPVWEHSIPVERNGNAERLAATLRRAAGLCGAHGWQPEAEPFAVGATVRLSLATPPGGDVIGTVRGHTPDSITLAVASSDTLSPESMRSVPLSQVTWAGVSRGDRSFGFAGFMIGALTGAACGAIVSVATADYECHPRYCLEGVCFGEICSGTKVGERAAIIGPISVLAGGGVGFVIGSMLRVERWDRVQLRMSGEANGTLGVFGSLRF